MRPHSWYTKDAHKCYLSSLKPGGGKAQLGWRVLEGTGSNTGVKDETSLPLSESRVH